MIRAVPQGLTFELKRIARLSGWTRVDPLLFCHIPKCAGTSFRAIIESEYRAEQRLFVYNGELVLTEPNAQFLDQFQRIRPVVQILYGHFSFGVHRFLGIPPCYATIVREPVARVISLYHHLARDPTSRFFERINGGLSIKQFVAGHYSAMTNNHMTKLLAGLPAGLVGVVYDNALLDQAKENIQNYFCVTGTMDAMDDVVRVLGWRFGWRNHVIPALNVTPPSCVDLDDETRDVILEHNNLDVALYEWVVRRGINPAGASA